MKHCPNCNAETTDNFDICWSCNYCFSEKRVIDFDKEMENHRDVNCLRCDTRLLYSGIFNFQEKIHSGVAFFVPWLAIAFAKKQGFEIYVCPDCSKVEFFVPITPKSILEQKNSLDEHLKF